MTNGQTYGLLTFVLVVILLIIFWKPISEAWNKAFTSNTPPTPVAKEGDSCQLPNGVNGTIINGSCVASATAQRNILVYNNDTNISPAKPNNNSALRNIVTGNSQAIQNDNTLRSTQFLRNISNGTILNDATKQAVYNKIINGQGGGSVNLPEACYSWANAVQDGAGHDALAYWWSKCSRALG